MFKLKIGDFNFLSFMCAVCLFVAILDLKETSLDFFVPDRFNFFVTYRVLLLIHFRRSVPQTTYFTFSFLLISTHFQAINECFHKSLTKWNLGNP